MSDPATLIALRDFLAYLYPDIPRARRVVNDAGLNTANIGFSSQSSVNWYNILDEADRANQVDSVIDVALKEYGSNDDLRHVVDQYRASVGAEVATAPETSPENLFDSSVLASGDSVGDLDEDAGSNVEHTVPYEVPAAAPDQALEANLSSPDGDDFLPANSSSDLSLMSEPDDHRTVPSWFPIMGAAMFVLTIGFFMWLIIAGRDLSDSQAFVAILIVSLTSAATTFFFGGWIRAEGSVTVDWLSGDPLKFAATGGVAAFVVVLIITTAAYRVLSRPSDVGAALIQPGPATAVPKDAVRLEGESLNTEPMDEKPSDADATSIGCDDLSIEHFMVADDVNVGASKLSDENSFHVSKRYTYTHPIAAAATTLIIGAAVSVDPEDCDILDSRFEWLIVEAGSDDPTVRIGEVLTYVAPVTAKVETVRLTATVTNVIDARTIQDAAYFVLKFIE